MANNIKKKNQNLLSLWAAFYVHSSTNCPLQLFSLPKILQDLDALRNITIKKNVTYVFRNRPHIVSIEGILRDYMWTIERLHIAYFKIRVPKENFTSFKGTKNISNPRFYAPSNKIALDLEVTCLGSSYRCSSRMINQILPVFPQICKPIKIKIQLIIKWPLRLNF